MVEQKEQIRKCGEEKKENIAKWRAVTTSIFDAFMEYKANVDTLIIGFTTLAISNNRLVNSLIAFEEVNRVTKAMIQTYSDVFLNSKKHHMRELLGRSYQMIMVLSWRLVGYGALEVKLRIAEN